MTKTTVTAYVPKSTNMVWYGHGKVVSFNFETGVVLVEMTSGSQKGSIGGFDLDKVKFTVTRTGMGV